jgi:hypothetical protein
MLARGCVDVTGTTVAMSTLMRATRVAARVSNLTAAVLALVAARHAGAQSFTPVDVHAALERLAHADWHPMPTDPEWLAVKSALDWELAASPRGEAASTVRQAAVRIEVGVSPLVSHDPRTASFSLDTRPWISTEIPLPYFVELYASVDGGQWTLVAAADGGATCEARVGDVAWPAPVSRAFHHVRLVADVYQLARPASAGSPRCGIRRRETSGSAADGPAGSIDTVALPTREPSALSHDRRTLPGLSFGALDASPRPEAGVRLDARRNEATGPGPSATRVSVEPEYSVFIRNAQHVPASAIDDSLPAMPLEAWLQTVVADIERERQFRNWWLPPEYCDADEGLRYRGEGSSLNGDVWPDTTELRRTPRSICASAVVPIETGILTLRLRVGTVVEDTGTWVVEQPSLYEAFVLGAGNYLDIPSLGEVPRMARVSEDVWPRPDISVTLSALSSPSEAVAMGVPVQLAIRIQNIGARDARYVHGTLVGGCTNRARHQFDVLTPVAAGDTVTVERAIAPTGPSICAAIVLSVITPNGLGGGLRSESVDPVTEDNVAIFLYGPPPK